MSPLKLSELLRSPRRSDRSVRSRERTRSWDEDSPTESVRVVVLSSTDRTIRETPMRSLSLRAGAERTCAGRRLVWTVPSCGAARACQARVADTGRRRAAAHERHGDDAVSKGSGHEGGGEAKRGHQRRRVCAHGHPDAAPKRAAASALPRDGSQPAGLASTETSVWGATVPLFAAE